MPGFFFGQLAERARQPEPTALGYLAGKGFAVSHCVMVDTTRRSPTERGALGASPGSFWGDQ
jgi:hypothetical protein